MSEKEMLLSLQRAMTDGLAKLELQLLVFDPKADDEEHDFLIRKMAMYRDNLITIRQRLNELD